MRRFFMPDSIYSWLSLYVIPIFTVMLASVLPWSESNLSIIGNYYEKKLGLLLWGVMVAFYIFFFMQYLFEKIDYKDTACQILLFINCTLILLAVSTPYLPDRFPVRSFLHEVFAFFIPIFYSFVIFRFLRHLHRLDNKFFVIFWVFLWAITLVSVLLLGRFGFVSSLLEIFVTLSICYYIRYLDIKINIYMEQEKRKI